MDYTRLQAAFEYYLGKMFVITVNSDAPYPRPVAIASRVEIMKY
ncbi:MAG: hypothetical protein AAF171_18010 [Cyanobacteria bacterium P01_A01_bin.116]